MLAPQAQGQPPALHRTRVAELLAAPSLQDLAWRQMLFQSLSRLELEPGAIALPGWEALAASGRDADLSNRILYCRRHELPLPDPAVGEDVDSALERCLAAWGAGHWLEAADRLRGASASWPADDRLSSNLLWLERRPPPALDPKADARGCALAVLAARRAIP